MPEKVSVNERAKVTAGLAKDVEEVKKYAEPIQPATTKGAALPLPWDPKIFIKNSRPAVATTSERK